MVTISSGFWDFWLGSGVYACMCVCSIVYVLEFLFASDWWLGGLYLVNSIFGHRLRFELIRFLSSLGNLNSFIDINNHRVNKPNQTKPIESFEWWR